MTGESPDLWLGGVYSLIRYRDSRLRCIIYGYNPVYKIDYINMMANIIIEIKQSNEKF